MRGCGEALGRTSITLEMRLVSRGPRTYAAVLGKVLTAWENPFIHILQMSKCYMNKYAYDLFNDISWQQGARPLAIRGQTPKGHFERSGAPPLSFRTEARSAGVEKPRPRVPRLGAGGGAELSRGAIKGGTSAERARGRGKPKGCSRNASKMYEIRDIFCISVREIEACKIIPRTDKESGENRMQNVPVELS